MEFHCFTNDNASLLKIVPSEEEKGAIDICCVIDNSYSMGDAAVKDPNAEAALRKLSILDIVKHAVRTIANSCSEKDTLTIVIYNTNPELIFSRGICNKVGKETINQKLKGVKHQGQTNLWAGLKKGLIELGTSHDISNRQKHIILLTDGQPNIDPPRGYEESLRSMRERGFDSRIHTVAFGYTANVKLMVQIQDSGFYFIPDSSSVGTVFVHIAATCLTMKSSNNNVKIQLNNTIFENGSTYKYIDVGSLNIGQPKTFIMPPINKIKTPVDGEIYFNNETGISLKVKFLVKNESAEIEYQQLRLLYLDMLNNIIKCDNNVNGESLRKECLTKIEAASFNTYSPIKSLVQELRDQIQAACSNSDWFEKWGKSHIRSHFSAHYRQQCNNWKDPSVQYYNMGILYNKIKDNADDAFSNIPAPEGSIRPLGQTVAVDDDIQTPMYSMHTQDGPCFAGSCKALLKSGRTCNVSDLMVEDEIITTIRDLTKTAKIIGITYTCGLIEVIKIRKGPTVTPWHPVKEAIYREWEIPKGKTDTVYVVYNIALDKHHSISLNDWDVITLGHNNTSDPVAKHPYFGTQRVIDDLSKFEAWKRRFPIELHNENIYRNKDTGLIDSISE